MPIYEYQCEACGQHTEIMQKISALPETVCPHCQQPTLKRLVSAAGFQLKGTGWYVTDFRNKEKPLTEKSTTAAIEKTEKATPTTETKPAEKKSETKNQPQDVKTDK